MLEKFLGMVLGSIIVFAITIFTNMITNEIHYNNFKKELEKEEKESIERSKLFYPIDIKDYIEIVYKKDGKIVKTEKIKINF